MKGFTMNAQEAEEICIALARLHNDNADSCIRLRQIALFVKQQQNTIVNLRLADKEEVSALKAENARLKKAILNYGKGVDFDWDVLAKIDELEAENARLKKIIENANTCSRPY